MTMTWRWQKLNIKNEWVIVIEQQINRIGKKDKTYGYIHFQIVAKKCILYENKEIFSSKTEKRLLYESTDHNGSFTNRRTQNWNGPTKEAK